MYSNIFFIDTVILFPIIMHFLIKLFKENKCLGFILTLSYSLMLSISLTYMIYLFIIFSSFLALKLLIEKEQRKKIIFNLSISLVIPLLIAGIAYIPTIFQILSSNRVQDVVNFSYCKFLPLKIFNLMMSSLILALFLKYLIVNKNKEKNKKIFYILILVLTTIGIIIEPINKAWQTGNYNFFPYRYAFIPIFVLICSSLEFLKSNKFDKDFKFNIKSIVSIIITFISMFLVFIIYIIKKESIIKLVIGYHLKIRIFIILFIIALLFLISYYLIISLKNNKIIKILIPIIALIEIFIFSNFVFICEKSESYLYLDRKEKLNISSNELYKYVDYSSESTSNSSYITRSATLSNWLHILPQKQLLFFRNLGYDTLQTTVFGTGGTIFTDTILSVKKLYFSSKIESNIYNFDSTIDEVYTYENKYNTSFGFLYTDNFDDIDLKNNFSNQNYYYKKYFNKDNDLINIKKITLKDNKIKIENNDDIVLYLNNNQDLDSFELIINGETKVISNSKEIINLGEYSSDIDIEIVEYNYFKNTEFEFGYIKMNDYIDLIDKLKVEYNEFSFNKNQLHINIDSDKEQYLFLPINNIDGWHIKINGKESKIEDTMYTFMSIKLNKGNNNIVMYFYPPYLKEGMLISLIGILTLIGFMIFKERIYNIDVIRKIIVFMYYFVSIVLFIYVYIISNFVLM